MNTKSPYRISKAAFLMLLSLLLSTKTPAQKTAFRPVITMDQMIGANAFIDDPVDKISAVGFIREYHNWEWDENGSNYKGYPESKIRWAPNNWNFDAFYTSLKKAQVGVSPCIQGAPAWLQGNGKFVSSHKPLDKAGADPANPESYRTKAHHMFQFAARYGSRKVADNRLTLAADQPRNSGMGLVQYIEDWNEQDRTWEGPDAHFSASQYAAMASADYDGHCKTMNTDSTAFGVKNADPDIKFVMGGLVELNTGYIADMQKWFTKNRPDGKFAADVINFHHYAWKDGQSWQGGGPAKSPEEDHFKSRLEAVVRYRDENLPGVQVWISEFGWDTNPLSRLSPPAIGPFDVQEVQAQWLVRSYLAFAAARVDRAQMFMLRDVNPADTTWFASCGLVGPKGDWTPKKSWYYVYTLKNKLKGMVYTGEEASADPNILIYKFKDVIGKNGMYVIWSKTKENYEVKDFELSIGGKQKRVIKTSMAFGKTNGIDSSLAVRGGKITLHITERPQFISVAEMQ
jgi:hypothetical protein